MDIQSRRSLANWSTLVELWKGARSSGGTDRAALAKMVAQTQAPADVDALLTILQKNERLLEKAALAMAKDEPPEPEVAAALTAACSDLGWEQVSEPEALDEKTRTLLQVLRDQPLTKWVGIGATVVAVAAPATELHSPAVRLHDNDTLNVFDPDGYSGDFLINVLNRDPLWIHGTVLTPEARTDLANTLADSSDAGTVRVVVTDSVAGTQAIEQKLREGLPNGDATQVLVVNVATGDSTLVAGPAAVLTDTLPDTVDALVDTVGAWTGVSIAAPRDTSLTRIPTRNVLPVESKNLSAQQKVELKDFRAMWLNLYGDVPPKEQPAWVWLEGIGFQGDPLAKIPAYQDGRFNPEVRKLSEEEIRSGQIRGEKEKSKFKENMEDWKGLRGRAKGYDPAEYFDLSDRLAYDITQSAGSLLPEQVEQGLVNCFWASSLHASLAADGKFIDRAVHEVPVEKLQKLFPNMAPELRKLKWFEVTLFPQNALGPHAVKVYVNELTNDHLYAMDAKGEQMGDAGKAPMSMDQLKAVMFEKAFAVFQGSYSELEWGNAKNALVNMHGTAGGYVFTDFRSKRHVYSTIQRNLKLGYATVAVAYDVRSNLDGDVGAAQFLLKMFKERDASKYDVVDQHCYSLVEARVERDAQGKKVRVVYVRNPHLDENHDADDWMAMPATRKGPEWETYLQHCKRMTLDEFYDAYTFMAYAPVRMQGRLYQ